MRIPLRILCAFIAIALAGVAPAQVIINEIHYHPVEEPAFDAAGNPTLDLTEDVHEFIELRNPTPSAVDLSNWTLEDGVTFTIPAGTTIPANGFRVIAKNPTRLQTVYVGLTNVLGPYSGVLSNKSDTVKLKNAAGVVVDSVSYEAAFPWAVSADALGAGSAFTGLNHYTYQYKGRSLERVSPSASSNDPANWLASPVSPGPSPGTANTVSRTTPKPVVNRFTVLQASDESPTIRNGQGVKVEVDFTSTASLSQVQLEWFVDNIEVTDETRTTIAMTDVGNGRWSTSAPIPGQADRSVVRWRIKADRGTGVEIVSPRADDPQIAPIGAAGAREAWHAYFVEPVRSSSKPIYDFFISAANVTNLNTNAAPPKRMQSNGIYPRDDAKDGYFPANNNYNPVNYPAAGQPRWDGVVPAVFVRNGVVYDITARYHGSRYQRDASKNSWKFGFPATKLMDGKQRILVTEKTNATVLGLGIFREANLPASYSQFVDFYKNSDPVIQRCEITDNDEETVGQYQREQEDLNPQNPPVFNGLGIIYKSKGLDGNEGPYGWANGQPMPANGIWASLDRYIWTFPSQLNDWRGCVPMKSMVDAMWTARGDAAQLGYPNNYAGQSHNNQTAVTANLANLRAYLAANWDVDKMLTYLAIRNWCSPWDDKFHNHYVYLQPDNRWVMIPWDFDGEMQGNDANTASPTNSILAGRKNDTAGSYSNNSRGPNWFKDAFLRAYEAEYKERLFILNNTLLAPANIQAIAAAYGTTVPDGNWLTNRFNSVNTQCGLGTWQAPNQPTHIAPASGGGIVPPASLTTSAYTHTSGNTVGANAHARTLWEIRKSTGTYRKPVYKVSSTTNLTSLPVPFELLEFGQSYAWRVTYYDASGHPSATSAETTFGFGPQPSNVTLINFADSWKYNHTATFTDNTWAQAGFNDASWSSGPGILAAENQASIPETIRTTLPAPGTLSPAGRAYYFRRTFDFPGNPATSTVRIRHLIDDGCVIWINGQRVHRFMMNDQANYATADFATGTPPNGDAAYQFADAITGTNTWAYVDPRPFLVQGTNTIAVEVHQNGGGSSDIVFGLELTASIITSGGDVALNEILADNRSAVLNGASRPDYLEIRNNTAAPVSLTGWGLSDDVLVPNRFTFPAGTTIPAAGRLIVWCDSNFAEPGLHTGFGLSANGQTVVLFQGTNVRDFVTFGPQAPDVAIGRIADGVGTWGAVAPTPNATNTALSTGTTATLSFNEWMANPGSGEDWFELYNSGANPVPIGGLWLSDSTTSAITQIPPLSFIGGRGFTRFEADGTSDGGNHVNFKLGASGDSLALFASNGTTLLTSTTFGSQGLGISAGRLPDGTATITTFPQTPSPGASNWIPSSVVINEALANSLLPLEDSIELHNPTGAAVNIGNWWLSDDRRDRLKYRIPAGTTIPAGGYATFTDSQFGVGVNAFSLSSLGDEIVLTAVDGGGAETGVRAQVSFGASAENVSFGHIATGGLPEFWPLTARTPGSANAAPIIGPIVINEVHYHPPDIGANDNTRDEFVELHNISGQAVSLTGWRLKGESDFTFPAGVQLRPGDYILLVGFNPATDTASLNAFKLALNVPGNALIYGPFTPKLGNSTASVEIAFPAGGAHVNMDKVVYQDFAPWPANADGNGSSLQRQSRSVIGNDPANWVAATPSPGSVNAGQTPITDNDQDTLPNVYEVTYGLDPYDAADALLDTDGDGATNAAEYAAGTSPIDPNDVFVTEVLPAAGGLFKVRFEAKAGKSYTIQFKSALSAPTWEKVTDINAPVSDTTVEHTDPQSNQLQRFYRVITPQQP